MSMTSLDLSRNNLGPLGAAAMARMLTSPTGPHRMRRLILASTAIGPDGAAQLASAMTASLNPGSEVGRVTNEDGPYQTICLKLVDKFEVDVFKVRDPCN